MRILFLSWRDLGHPLAGGSEVLVDELASGLHARGHDVTLLAAGPLSAHSYRAVESRGRLRQYLTDPLVARQLGPQDVIVDVCNGIPFFSPLWTRTPVVLLVNHIHFGMWREWFSPPVSLVGATIETKVMPRLYRNRRVVAVSESTAKALAGLGVPDRQISVVHNGVDVASVGRRTTPRATEPTFLAMGRLVPHKRFDLLLRAWSHVRRETGGRLLIAGDGPLRAQLDRTRPPGVELLGWVSEEEKRALMEQAWLLVQPSRLEGWGLVVMEAAAAGTPTLGFWAPGTRDAVEHQASGILVRTERELVDAWISLAQDPEQRRVLSKGAEERAMAFSWTRSVDAFEQVLREATGAVPAQLPEARAPVEARPARSRRAIQGLREKADMLRLFRHEKHDPRPFYLRLAEQSVATLPYRVAGQRVLDLGSGPGHFAAALRAAGASPIAIDLNEAALQESDVALPGRLRADARRLPLPDDAVQGVFCANMLEHTPDPAAVLHEIARVLEPGGWAWVSWTNWYSPWGGHEIVPFHYLGPRLGTRVWRRFFGEPRKNVPFDGLWPTHIGQVLRMVSRHPALELRDVYPRYYPSQRWVARLPGLREVLTWNCVLLLQRREHVSVEPDPPIAFETGGARALARRGLRRIRQAIGDDPVFLPVVLRATPIGTSRRITAETELVIEGYPRSGNTFAHFAVLRAEPGAVITSRVHTPSQVKRAVALGAPTLLTIRGPIDSIASTVVAAPHVPIRTLLQEYIHHYEQLYPYLDRVLVATFDEITSDFDVVIDALNERFSLGFRHFGHTQERTAAVFADIEQHHRQHWGDDQAGLPLPIASQRALKDRVRREVQRPEYASLLFEAQTVYDTVAARSITAPASPGRC